MSLLVVGSVALDTVYTPKGEIVEGLGGSATYFSVSASHFTPVHIVGIVGTDFPKEHINRLTVKGVDIEGLCTKDGKTFRWSGRYDESFADPQTLDTQLNVFADFSPQLPHRYREIPFLFLGNIHPALQLQVLEQMDKPKFIALDTMNFWIERERKLLLEVFKKIDMAVINELEVRMLTGLRSIPAGMKKIQQLGPKIVVVKRGAYGSITLIENELFLLAAYPTENVIDPTGAGDSFAGGMMGYIAHHRKITPKVLRNAVVYGTIIGSFCVEGFSIHRLEELNAETIEKRLVKFREMMNF